jgi:hypothetical protein
LFAALLVAKGKNKQKNNFFYKSQFMSWVMAIWDEPAKPTGGWLQQRLV